MLPNSKTPFTKVFADIFKAKTEMSLSLVANYSDSDSEDGDDEKTNVPKAVDHISDEEDFHHDHNNRTDDYFEEEPDVFSIISQLPIAKVKRTEATYVDEAEVKRLLKIFEYF